VTGTVIADQHSSDILDSAGLKPFPQDAALRGITERVALHAIP